MDLTKKASGENYKFASEELITEFIRLCKESGTEDFQIKEMLESLEGSKIDQINRSFEPA